MIKVYRKIPVEIEALKWDGENFAEVKQFCPAATWIDDELSILTLEGDMSASVGDYIIKGVKGEFYPCKPDIFKLTYEEVLS